MAQVDNETSFPPAWVPHHLLNRGDVFESKLSKEADIVAGFYILIIGILSAIGNGYVIYMSFKRKTKLKPPELMTVNLAIFDFGISVTGKPFFVVSSFSHRWIFGWRGCHFYGWAGFFFGCGSLITMTVVSLDRYLKICHLSYATWIKRHHAFICLVFIWLYATFWATMPLVGWGNYAPEPFGTSCTLDWWLAQASVAGQSFVMTILMFCLVLPTGIIVFSYVMIIFKVKSSAKEVSYFDTRNKNNHILEIKLTKVAMLICAGFLIAWIPYAVVSVVSAFGEPDTVPIPVSVIPCMLAKSSAMYNPIIYQVISCRGSCFQAMKKKRHCKSSRFYTISASMKDRAAQETHTEI
ncbi:opsin-5-like [Denticeps clupeoides]|uniref:Opsin-5 n=1 Tax=Denticeps clupeoides TaxID=299321 RepID=A0A8C4AD40_9TELE|nr:opsin-5-like [Denticeps clupeoides]XP_028820940.1 opsin-5-like [Denticeps clupeoides]